MSRRYRFCYNPSMAVVLIAWVSVSLPLCLAFLRAAGQPRPTPADDLLVASDNNHAAEPMTGNLTPACRPADAALATPVSAH